MKTLKNCPELMTVIINIQTMSKKVNSDYDEQKEFKQLQKMNEDELYTLQDEMIIKYNESFKK